MKMPGPNQDLSGTCCFCFSLALDSLRGLLWLGLLAPFTEGGLLAYDCRLSSANVSRLSLAEVARCPEEILDTEPEEVSLQVLQSRTTARVHVYSCLIYSQKTTFYCGMSSHHSAVKNGFRKEVYKISAEDCLALHSTGKFIFPPNIAVQDVQPNASRAYDLNEGELDTIGTCAWKTHFSTGQIHVKITDYYATVRTEDNLIQLQGGTVCAYSDLKCFDSDFGRAAWRPLGDRVCSPTSLDVLYQGKAQKMIAPTPMRVENRTYVMVNSFDHIFALRLTRPFHHCGKTLWQTEHPLLSIDFGPEFYFQESIVASDRQVDLLSYVNSKFLFVELSTSRSLQTIYQHSLYRRCLLERDMLLNRLAVARSAPDVVSFLIKNAPGYLARTIGSVLYVIQCSPTMVTLRRSTRCFQEIPVTFNDTPWFLSPISRILTEHGEEVQCGRLAPPVHMLEGVWTALTPDPIQVNAPTLLQPFSDQELSFSAIRPLSEGGLYTNSEVRDLQKALTFPSQRAVINHIMSARIAGNDFQGQGYDFTSVFNTLEVKKLAQSALAEAWAGFEAFGTWTSGVFGIYLVFRVVKYILSVTFNAINIYSTFGCGFSLLASLWNALTLWVLRNSLVKPALRDLETAIAHEQQDVSSSHYERPAAISALSRAPSAAVLPHQASMQVSPSPQAPPLYSNIALV